MSSDKAHVCDGKNSKCNQFDISYADLCSLVSRRFHRAQVSLFACIRVQTRAQSRCYQGWRRYRANGQSHRSIGFPRERIRLCNQLRWVWQLEPFRPHSVHPDVPGKAKHCNHSPRNQDHFQHFSAVDAVHFVQRRSASLLGPQSEVILCLLFMQFCGSFWRTAWHPFIKPLCDLL